MHSALPFTIISRLVVHWKLKYNSVVFLCNKKRNNFTNTASWGMSTEQPKSFFFLEGFEASCQRSWLFWIWDHDRSLKLYPHYLPPSFPSPSPPQPPVHLTIFSEKTNAQKNFLHNIRIEYAFNSTNNNSCLKIFTFMFRNARRCSSNAPQNNFIFSWMCWFDRIHFNSP